jgi:hypothetical protein
VVEFIRRFLLHILPRGFVRIRQFGFLANRARGKKLARCAAHCFSAPPATAKIAVTSPEEKDAKAREQDRKRCPARKLGYMVLVGIIPAIRLTALLPRQDSS